MAKRVTGIGGIFFEAEDPEKLRAWYEEHLGIGPLDHGAHTFEWKRSEAPDENGTTVWSIFERDTKYFEPSKKPFMINYRVDDLYGVLEALRAEGVDVEEKVEESDYGKFGWVIDPEGNKIELWEPPEGR